MGSGTVVMENLDQYQILIRSEGVANILASGKVFSVGAQQDGVGNIDLSNLLTTKAHLNLSGTGSIHASVSENVENEITGTGIITVAGNPMIRGQTVTGTGRVEYV
jgi:hypothetical protein